MLYRFLLLAAACHGLAVRKVERLPKPALLVMTALDPPALQVEWGPVKSADKEDPVIGYKVKVWELQPIQVVKVEEVDGVKTLVKELVSPQMTDAETPSEEYANEIIVPGPLAFKAKIPNIKLNVIYEVRVRAFTRRHEGPLSDHMRVQILDDEKNKEIRSDNQEYNFV